MQSHLTFLKANFFSKKKNLILLLSFFLLFSSTSFSQAEGELIIRGQTQKADSKLRKDVVLPNASITLFDGDVKLAVKKSDKNGVFEFENLKFGKVYKVVFSSPACIEMFMIVDATIPDKYLNYRLGIDNNYIFHETNEKNIDAKKFNYPFMKAAFSSKEKKMIVDENYTQNFIAGIIPEMKLDEEKTLADKKAKEKTEAEYFEKQKKDAALVALEKQKIKIAGKLFSGENPSKPIANIALKLTNEKGETIQIVSTNFLGAFVFYILPTTNYEILSEANSKIKPLTKIAFVNKNENELQTTIAEANGAFRFKLSTNDSKLLSLITVNDADLKMDIKGKILSGDGPVNRPIADVKINLMNVKAELVQSIKTDNEGSFAFTYLSNSENYSIAFDADNPQLSTTKKIILATEKGTAVDEIAGTTFKEFKFQLLPFGKSTLTTMYVDDPWLQIANLSINNNAKSVEQIITENIYFNVNDDQLLPDAKKTLDKVIAVLFANSTISLVLSSHTDAQGADDYNLKLSERRAKAAVDYIVGNGIVATRVSGKGYGETHLLNKCVNNVKCSEQEHAKNRRLEFKILKSK